MKTTGPSGTLTSRNWRTAIAAATLRVGAAFAFAALATLAIAAWGLVPSRNAPAVSMRRDTVHELRMADRFPSTWVLAPQDGTTRRPYADLLSGFISEFGLRHPEVRVEACVGPPASSGDAGSAPTTGPDGRQEEGPGPAAFDIVSDTFWPVVDLILGTASLSAPFPLGRYVDAATRADFVLEYLAALTDAEGQLWALPRWVRAPMATVSTQQAAAAGLDLPSIRSGGWTWEGFLEACSKLRAVSAGGKSTARTGRGQPVVAADDLWGDVFRLLLANALPASNPAAGEGRPSEPTATGVAAHGTGGMASAVRSTAAFIAQLTAQNLAFSPEASWFGRSVDLLWQGKAAVVLGTYEWSARGYSRVALTVPLPSPSTPRAGLQGAAASGPPAYALVPLPHRDGSPEASLVEVAPVWVPTRRGQRLAAERAKLLAELAAHLCSGPCAALGGEYGWDAATLSARASRAAQPGSRLDALRLNYLDRASANLITWAIALRNKASGKSPDPAAAADRDAWASVLRAPLGHGTPRDCLWSPELLQALRRLWEGRLSPDELAVRLAGPGGAPE